MDRKEKYLKKYSLDLIARDSSLQQYEDFVKNFREDLSIAKLVEEKLKTNKQIKVFDIGCGEGQALKELKDKFDQTGKQIFTIGIDLVAPKNKKNLDQFILGDALEKEFPKEIDLVLSFKTLHEIGSCEKLVAKVAGCLAKKGKAILSFRTTEGEMKKVDVEFLEKLVDTEKFNDCKVEGKRHYQTLEQFYPLHTTKFLVGITLLLEKN